MIIDIHNDYVKRIQDLEKDKTNLVKELNEVYREKCSIEIKLDNILDTVASQKKEIELGKKANKVLEDRIKELNKLNGFYKECKELLLNANKSTTKETHKKATLKDLKLEKYNKISPEAKEKLK